MEKEKIDSILVTLETKRLECDELKSQLAIKNKELDAFSYSIGHDLNAPLTHIIGFLGLLEERLSGKLDEKSLDFFKKVSDASMKLALMIEALTKLSRINRTVIDLKRVNLNNVISEILLEFKPLLESRNIEWKLNKLPEITADPELIKQAFTDLIHNAIKFTQLNSPAVIEIGTKLSEDNYQIIFVKDNGVGFDNQHAEQILGAFQRLHKETEFAGIGMGLARVACIINKHNGKVHVDGTLGKGSTFSCFFSAVP